MLVKLDDKTLEWCKKLAHARNSIKEANNVNNHRVDPNLKDWEAHYLGLRGEAAVAKICKLHIDEKIYLKGDGGVLDFTTSKGKTLQVKTRKDFKDRKDIFLFFNHLNLLPKSSTCECCAQTIRRSEVILADFAILVVSDKSDESLMDVVGSISREKFLRECQEMNFGYGKRFGVSHRFLTPISVPNA